MCVARSVQPKELGSQLFIDLPSCFVSLSLSLALSYSLREEVSVAVVRAFPDLAQGLITLKKVVGKKKSRGGGDTEIQGRRERGRVGKR